MNDKTKLFLDLDGLPYLLAEYLDKREFRTVDRSLIKSSIVVNNAEAYRAIVDINIDDIGKRASDGLPSTLGNRTKQIKLLQAICNNAPRLNQVMDTMRRGIILRVNYRLENIRTGVIIRSASEDLRITNRNYFIDINSDDINNNAIIVNFMDTLVSTLNQFTHGTDRMMIRLTSVELFYEVMKRNPKYSGHHHQPHWGDGHECNCVDPHFNPYYHHQHYQTHQNLCGDRCETIIPTSWWMFNRYYHFDNVGSDIILHIQEIEDKSNASYLVPCGFVHVNRAFEINPGHRIVFKFSVWKNDVIAVNNTAKIAKALGSPMIDYPWRFENRAAFIKLLKELLHENNVSNEANINAILIKLRNLLDGSNCCPVYDCSDPTTPSDENDPIAGDEDDIPDDSGGCDCNALTIAQITDLINEIGL